MNEDHAPYVDLDRSITLGNVGSPGYAACTLIDAAGEEFLALIYVATVNSHDDGPSMFVDWNSIAPHELKGRLPRAYAPKCDHRASTSGKPCRNLVGRYGDRCPWHQDTQHNVHAPAGGTA